MIAVWAPAATKVELVVVDGSGSGERVPMDGPDARGWFRAPVDLGPHDRYGFSVDSREARPDPRSPWQPDGVHGLSRPVKHSDFAWTDQSWAGHRLDGKSVIYELHAGTFSPEGTFEGAARRLDHLVDLGVDVVELMPVAEFPGSRGWGYDGVDLFAPHSGYGGPTGLKTFVDAAHRLGLAVVIDVVYNHLGPAGNYLGEFGPYFTDRYVTPWGEAVNLDGSGSDEVRRLILDNATMWLCDYHADGLRLDAVHAILDTSAVHLLEELAEHVAGVSAGIGRPLFLVAESDLNDPRVVSDPEVGGYGVDAQWSDGFHHALHALLTGERGGYYADFGSLASLAKALRQAFVLDGVYSTFRRRHHGRPPTGLPASRFVGYMQNHDQVGNRALGERSSMLVDRGLQEVAAALVLLGPLVPMLFQGEEWAARTPFLYFTDHEDPELGRAVREGRRREFASFGWSADHVPDPQAVETFERSLLDWSELDDPNHRAMLDWHRQLIALRRAEPALSSGSFDDLEVRSDDEGQWLAVERGDMTIACNLAAEPRTVPGITGPVLLSSGGGRCDDQVAARGGGLALPPQSVAVVRRAPA